MSKLEFAHIQFYGIDSLEPAFDPKIKDYTIRRRAGTDMSFVACMNQPPQPPCTDGGWSTPQFPGYSLEFHVAGNDTKDFWAVGQVTGVNCGVGTRDLEICCVKSKRNHDENAQTVYLHFVVITEPMSAAEISACTHRKTHTSEGECWGGASGSCSVEILTYCDDCGEMIGKSWDYRN